MTRLEPTLTSMLFRSVSGAALTVGIAAVPRMQRDASNASLGFLARLGLWLKLIFGVGCGSCEARAISCIDYVPSRAQIRARDHRQKRRGSTRKHPAHDLEMLMRFVPDASGRGLRLNQYR